MRAIEKHSRLGPKSRIALMLSTPVALAFVLGIFTANQHPASLAIQPQSSNTQDVRTIYKHAATFHQKHLISYDLEGNVTVGFPNFSGVLPIIFNGSFTRNKSDHLRIVVDGTPEPTGLLTLKSSSADIKVPYLSEFTGRVITYTPVFLRLALTSSAGKVYIGTFYTHINGLTRTFTAQLTLNEQGTVST